MEQMTKRSGKREYQYRKKRERAIYPKCKEDDRKGKTASKEPRSKKNMNKEDEELVGEGRLDR
jgi:hypothetical protein